MNAKSGKSSFGYNFKVSKENDETKVKAVVRRMQKNGKKDDETKKVVNKRKNGGY